MLELQIKDLCVGYNGKEILHNISLDIENGSFIAIVGPSGAGKSTLLKQINRLDPGKTGGSILWLFRYESLPLGFSRQIGRAHV